MIVIVEGPRGGNLDIGLQAYTILAIRSFAKQLNIHRLKTCIQIKFHHKLFVDKDNTSYGLCEAVDNRNFIIDVALYGNWLSTLAHELVHVKQFARGELNESLTRWKNKNHEKTEYWDQPWEKEARRLQNKLLEQFMESE
jgi:hypothetical protein